jgi:hypothetical protein
MPGQNAQELSRQSMLSTSLSLLEINNSFSLVIYLFFVLCNQRSKNQQKKIMLDRVQHWRPAGKKNKKNKTNNRERHRQLLVVKPSIVHFLCLKKEVPRGTSLFSVHFLAHPGTGIQN